MANLISVTERFAYLRIKVDRAIYEALKSRFGGEGFALREVRWRVDQAVQSLAMDAVTNAPPADALSKSYRDASDGY